MKKDERGPKEYPIDPNFTGAFAGGPPRLSPEEAQRLIENGDEVDQEIQERWARILKKRAEADAQDTKDN